MFFPKISNNRNSNTSRVPAIRRTPAKWRDARKSSNSRHTPATETTRNKQQTHVSNRYDEK
jgi:hypothetical protein